MRYYIHNAQRNYTISSDQLQNVLHIIDEHGRWKLVAYGNSKIYDVQLAITDGKQVFKFHSVLDYDDRNLTSITSHNWTDDELNEWWCLCRELRLNCGVRSYVNRRKWRGKTPIINNRDKMDWGKSYDWGWVISHKRGKRPRLYIPNNLDVSVLLHKYAHHSEHVIIHNCAIKIEDNNIGKNAYSSNYSTFKFSRGDNDYLITHIFIDDIDSISRTITNGGGHKIYIYNVTNIDLRKKWDCDHYFNT